MIYRIFSKIITSRDHSKSQKQNIQVPALDCILGQDMTEFQLCMENEVSAELKFLDSIRAAPACPVFQNLLPALLYSNTLENKISVTLYSFQIQNSSKSSN